MKAVAGVRERERAAGAVHGDPGDGRGQVAVGSTGLRPLPVEEARLTRREPEPRASRRRAVEDLVDGLQDVVYTALREGSPPSFFRTQAPRELLEERIALALAAAGHAGGRVSRAEDGCARTRAFFASIPELVRSLEGDIAAALAGDPAAQTAEEVALCYPGVEAVTAYRIAHRLHRLEVPLLPRMVTECAHSRTGIDIHPAATIGRHFFIDHGTGVVIGETAEIGDRVKLYQGVTLGAISPKRVHGDGTVVKRHPTLEDDVVVYANATLLGGATVVGHHSVIGSNVWLSKSVPPRTLVSLESPVLRHRDLRSRGDGEMRHARPA